MFRTVLLASLLATAAFAAKPGPDPLASFQQSDKTLQTLLRSGPRESLSSNEPLRQHLGSMFAFGELGKRALGKSWAKQSKADQDTFRVYFAKMVQKTALQNPQDYISDSAKSTLASRSGDSAVIRSSVFKGSDKVEITYKLFLDGAAWRVYDLKVGQKPSQLEKYRNQFVQFLSKKTFKDLIETVRKNGA